MTFTPAESAASKRVKEAVRRIAVEMLAAGDREYVWPNGLFGFGQEHHTAMLQIDRFGRVNLTAIYPGYILRSTILTLGREGML